MVITFKAPKKLVEELDREAIRRKISRSQLIREFIIKGLFDRPVKKPIRVKYVVLS